MGKPVRVASFVGRAEELAAIVSLARVHTLVTICGMGGVGKTTLAAEVSVRLDSNLRWVELAGVANQRGVDAALRAALDTWSESSSAAADATTDRLLLVLDNCEHVRDLVAAAILELVGVDGTARVIATSQQPLRVPGEAVFQLGPLGPADSCELFQQRASERNAAAGVEADDEAVAQICSHLDGLPLAIELAAARSAHLGVRDVLTMLADRFTLLTRGGTSVPERHQTLEASIRWGYDLLAEDEQLFLSRLAVFDGFGLNVLDAALLPPLEHSSPIDLLGALVDSSFVAVDRSSGHARYRLLESIRAFALDRLAERDEVAAMSARKLEAFELLARKANFDLGAGDYDAVFDSLAADIVNVRTAIDWAIEHGRSDRALLLAAAAAPFWAFHGQFGEMADRLQEALTTVDESTSAASTAGGMLSAGFTTMLHGDLPTAEQLLRQGAHVADDGDLELAREWCRALRWLACIWMGQYPTDDPAAAEEAVALARSTDNGFFLGTMLHVQATARALVDGPASGRASFDEARAVGVEHGLDAVTTWAAGFQAMFDALPSGDIVRTRDLIAEAHARAERLGFDAGDAAVLGVRALVEAHTGDIAAAHHALAELGERARVLGVTQFGRFLLGIATWAHHAIGDWDIAARDVKRQISVQAKGSVGWLLAPMHEVDGLLALADGRFDDAAEALERSLAVAADSHFVSEHARALVGLGQVERARLEPSSAAARGREALELVRAHGLGLVWPEAMDLLAGCALDSDAPERAARLIGGADRLRSDMGTAPRPHARREDIVSAIGERLSPDVHRAARAAGYDAVPDEMLDFALRGSGSNRRAIAGWDSLTPTERQVVDHVVEGLTNRVIADRMFVSPNTVKTHLSSVFRKLDLPNRAALAVLVTERTS